MADIYDEINDLEFEVVTMTDETVMQWSFPSLIMLLRRRTLPFGSGNRIDG